MYKKNEIENSNNKKEQCWTTGRSEQHVLKKCMPATLKKKKKKMIQREKLSLIVDTYCSTVAREPPCVSSFVMYFLELVRILNLFCWSFFVCVLGCNYSGYHN